MLPSLFTFAQNISALNKLVSTLLPATLRYLPIALRCLPTTFTCLPSTFTYPPTLYYRQLQSSQQNQNIKLPPLTLSLYKKSDFIRNAKADLSYFQKKIVNLQSV